MTEQLVINADSLKNDIERLMFTIQSRDEWDNKVSELYQSLIQKNFPDQQEIAQYPDHNDTGALLKKLKIKYTDELFK